MNMPSICRNSKVQNDSAFIEEKSVSQRPTAQRPSPASNTESKINLKCSDYNGGYGSVFNYNGQSVKKINENWSSNNNWKYYCQANK